MHIAAADAIEGRLLPRVRELRDALAAKAEAWEDIVKIGRTHLQDAVPLTLGQEFGGWVAQLDAELERIERRSPGCTSSRSAARPSAPGLNAPEGFGGAAAAKIAEITGLPFRRRRTCSRRSPRTTRWCS